MLVRVSVDHLDLLLNLFVSGDFLCDHSDRLFGNNLGLDGHAHHRLDAKDITLDLVAKLDAASLHAEERGVSAFIHGSLALDSELIGLTDWHSSVQSHNLCLHVIARGLNELSSSGPGTVAVVAHPPGLAEDVATDDLMLVREALLDKAG